MDYTGQKAEKNDKLSNKKWLCMCVCVYGSVCLLYIFNHSPLEGLGHWLLLIDQTDFTDWISSISSELMEEICLNPEALGINT